MMVGMLVLGNDANEMGLRLDKWLWYAGANRSAGIKPYQVDARLDGDPCQTSPRQMRQVLTFSQGRGPALCG